MAVVNLDLITFIHQCHSRVNLTPEKRYHLQNPNNGLLVLRL